MPASLALPPPAPQPAPVPFPVAACLAPLVAAVAIGLLTRSPLVLAFAALGPVLAVSSALEGRRRSRRDAARSAAQHAAALVALRHEVAAEHARERAERRAALPGAAMILAGQVPGPSPGPDGAAALISAGTGTGRSDLVLAGKAVCAEERELCAQAAVLTGSPVPVDPRLGVCLLGPPALTRAVARGYLIQLVHTLGPTRCSVVLPESGWEWARALSRDEEPGRHIAADMPRVVVEERPLQDGGALQDGADDQQREGEGSLRIVLAERVQQVPAGIRCVLATSAASTARIVAHPDPAVHGELLVEPVGAEEAAAFLGRVAVGRPGRGIPLTVSFAQLVQCGQGAWDGILGCPIGIGAHGAVSVDLARDGPHAVVAGTTGSGKSELLISWVASLAHRHSPEAVCFLLVDFKGGSAFGPLTVLPHCVGVVTDLDGALAARAVESLRAELLRRERVLHEAGARDVSGSHLPRLVIIVDEFAAMLDAHPGLQPLFTDLAARGRALGVHLILCTQRPNGVVREALLANCSLRLSLRVTNTSDSLALLGVPDAAALPAAIPGRCLVSVAGAPARPVQVAVISAGELRQIAATTRGHVPERPWLDPLPPYLPLAALPTAEPGAFRLGMLDIPSKQRQCLAEYRPRHDGSLLVLGGSGSGKSTLTVSLAQQGAPGSPGSPVCVVPAEVEGAWDVLTGFAAAVTGEEPAGSRARGLLVIDDLDVLIGRYDPDYSQAVCDLVAALLRTAPSADAALVCTARSLAGPVARLAPLFGSTLLLRMSNRQEHVLAGGSAGDYVETLQPGAGTWHSHLLQVASPAPGASRPARRPAAVPRPAGWGTVGEDEAGGPGEAGKSCRREVVVSTSPGEALRAIGRRHPGIRLVDVQEELGGSSRWDPADCTGPAVFVGDPEAWQAAWSLLTRLRSASRMLFEGCTPAQARSITRRRELPPPLALGSGHVWLWSAGSGYCRAARPW